MKKSIYSRVYISGIQNRQPIFLGLIKGTKQEIKIKISKSYSVSQKQVLVNPKIKGYFKD